MLIDITLKLSPKTIENAQGGEKKALTGHLGTHFDVMNKEFPLEYTERKGIVFDVSDVLNREICSEDVDLSLVEKDMFVAFHTGYIEQVTYGTKEYFSAHPQLSFKLIDKLLDLHVSIIGIDFAGVRRGAEHTPTDQRCADKNVFIIENLCNLRSVLQNRSQAFFIGNTYPMNFTDMTGLPCRVVAKV